MTRTSLAAQNALQAFLLMLSATFGSAQTSASENPAVHQGVASCASGVCHGATEESGSSKVQRNEYVIWLQQDRHANAYRSLQSAKGRAIASKLAIDDATSAAACLDCHADNVPSAQRGAKFQLSDGVGCEACHGGAAHWLAAHTNPEQQHADNIKAGLTPLERGPERAGVCLACHLGARSQFASHDMMAAGHPRLAFEMETFTALQPAHFRVDDDYRARKGAVDGMSLWLTGQFAAARRSLELIRDSRLKQNRIWPELALYDCHACHHPMNESHNSRHEAIAGIPYGSVRLNDGYFVVINTVLSVALPGKANELSLALRQLHGASVAAIPSLGADTEKLLQELGRAEVALQDHVWSVAQRKQLLIALAIDGRNAEFHDYVAAEQQAMALELVAYSIGQDYQQQIKPELDQIYAAVADEHHYRVANSIRAMTALLSKLGVVDVPVKN